MKTLKQIREEYDDRYMPLNESSEEVVLEAKSKSLMRSDIPSPSKMPTLLLFRRMSYRIFPQDQVVALYYSKMINKYLSVPFGPDGNVNLSESSVYDTLEEFELMEGAKWEAAKGAAKGALSGAVKGAAIGNAVAATPGAAAGAVIGGVRGALKGVKKSRQINEFNPLPLIGAAAGAAASAAGEALKSMNEPLFKRSKATSTELMRAKPGSKQKKSGDKSSVDPVTKAKLTAAELRQAATVKENKMSDIRAMIDSGAILHEMNINGKTITLNTSMAKRILEVYDSVNTKNKKIVEGMLNENLESFKKLLNFTIRN